MYIVAQSRAVFYYGAMDKSDLHEARTRALAKVYEQIGETGSPTQEQLALLRMVRAEENELTPAKLLGEAGSLGGIIDAFFGGPNK